MNPLRPRNVYENRHFVQVNQRIDRRRKKMASLSGLLRAFCMDSHAFSGCIAVQPPGFHTDVVMRKYQLQSLFFMLREESRKGGINSHFWAPIHSANGVGPSVCRAYYSPSLREFCSEEDYIKANAQTTYGGFLCDEMGLGKTIVSLSLILANPAPATGWSVFKQYCICNLLQKCRKAGEQCSSTQILKKPVAQRKSG